MGAVLIYIMAVGFLVVPATVIYTLVLLVAGLAAGHLFSYFTRPHTIILSVAAGLIALAVLLLLAFGKDLVVK